MPQSFEDGPWRSGCNSVGDPCSLSPGSYQWAVNCINKGGILSTRPGQGNVIHGETSKIRGIKIFTPRGGPATIVYSDGTRVRYCRYPFTPGSDREIEGLLFSNSDSIEFEVAVIGVTEDSDGNITQVDPYPVVMIYDGLARTAYWDGAVARHLDPDPNGAHETPICTWAKWIGNRLWTMQGRKLRVSNLLNPIKFTEEDILIEGGYFNLPDEGTGLGVTPDFRSLLAFTDFTTTSFQAGILNRAAWSTTPDFQKVIFSGIGCAAGRSIVNQYGKTWWYSHSGLISLDAALQTYRSSEIRYADGPMRRSRANFSRDISKICAAAYENYLLLSVPSGDQHNFHTWVMDSNPVESIDSPAIWSSVWTGIRPVQYATGVVNGVSRCFAASMDLPPDGSPEIIRSTGNVWELFFQDRRDIGYNIANAVTAKDISCSLETRSIYVNQLSSVKYAELDVQGVEGTVNWEIWYATRRGTYKKIGEGTIEATVGSVSPDTMIPATFEQYLPQRRTIKSVNETPLSGDNQSIVETPYTKNVDKYFSFLIKWTGVMSVTKMRIFTDAEPEATDGRVEAFEDTDRYVAADGSGEVLETGPTPRPVTPQVSSFVYSNNPRAVEEIYQSLT